MLVAGEWGWMTKDSKATAITRQVGVGHLAGHLRTSKLPFLRFHSLENEFDNIDSNMTFVLCTLLPSYFTMYLAVKHCNILYTHLRIIYHVLSP